MGIVLRAVLQRKRDRVDLSFLLAMIFFAALSIILLSEIFFMEKKNRSRASSHLDQNYRPSSTKDSPNFVQVHDTNRHLRVSGSTGGGSKFSSTAPLKLKDAPLPSVENLIATDGEWQPVTATKFKFFVFSAYLDQRVNKVIRVIAATKTVNPEQVSCRLWSPDGNESQIIAAQVKAIRENWNLIYSAVFILCPLPQKLTFGLASVSIIHQIHAPISNHLLIRNLNVPSPLSSPAPFHNSSSNTNFLAVCIQPIHFHYSKVNELIEFIELNLLLGMSHFTLYNVSIGPEANCVLEQYVNEGIVTVLPWKLDMVSEKEIRMVGIFAALNDCLYRSMHHYSYVAVIDLDEFIIPQQQETLPELIRWLAQKLGKTASYSFQNAFFYRQWPDDTSMSPRYSPIIDNFLTLRKTRRKVYLNPHTVRSKYICEPEFVVELGNHFIWEFMPGYGPLNVEPNVAMSHHYRVCEFGGDDCVKSESIVDRTVYRYASRLVVNFHTRYSKFSAFCRLPELSFTFSPVVKHYNLSDVSELSQGLSNLIRRASVKMKSSSTYDHQDKTDHVGIS